MGSGARFGTVRSRRGRWQARWYDDSWLQSATFDTEAQAWDHLATVRVDKLRGRYVDPGASRITMSGWAALAPTRAVRDTTKARNASYLANHVIGRLGNVPLVELSNRLAQQWINDLVSLLLAPATVHKCHQLLCRLVDAAVRDERLPENRVRNLELPRLPDTEARFLVPDELARLVGAFSEAWQPWPSFMADSRLRIGESFGVRVRDLDLLRGIVHVREIVTVASTRHTGPRELPRCGTAEDGGRAARRADAHQRNVRRARKQDPPAWPVSG